VFKVYADFLLGSFKSLRGLHATREVSNCSGVDFGEKPKFIDGFMVMENSEIN
jgi:hypothetical protein